VGILQFDVVAYRLRDEYWVEARFQPIDINTARWVTADDSSQLDEFKIRNGARVAIDNFGSLVYLASSPAILALTQEEWPQLRFLDSREQGDRRPAR
jgi:peptide chain release factor 3